MLDLTVAMRPLTYLLALVCFLLPMPVQAQTQTPPPVQVRITSPAKGDALQGVVTIQGTSAIKGYQRAEISFAYADNPTGTWFPLARTSDAVTAGALASWDTSTITDGDYALRLRVFLKDGTVQTVFVTGLRVRNYTPVETREPSPTATATRSAAGTSSTAAPPTSTPTPTSIALPPTALPLNPARVTVEAVDGSLLRGGAAAAAVFAGLGLYLALKALWRKF